MKTRIIILVVSVVGVIMLLGMWLSGFIMTEEDLAVYDGPELPDVWTSYTADNETRHVYYRLGYDCNLSISQRITDDDRRIYQTTMDCATTVASPSSRIMQDGQSIPVMSVFGEYDVILEDLPICSWDIRHMEKLHDADSDSDQTGLAMLESTCWIYDKSLTSILEGP